MPTEQNTVEDGMRAEVPLGCLGSTYLGTRRTQDKRHKQCSGFLDVALSPWRSGPWALCGSGWQDLHNEVASRISEKGSAGGIILFGENHSIESVLRSFKTLSTQHYLEIDLTRAIDKWAINLLVGAEPGYIGHDPKGSDFSKKLASVVSACSPKEGDAEHESHRPCPIVVFRNIHRAAPEVQQIVERLATKGQFPLPSGSQIECKSLLVVATAPDIFPPGDTPNGASRFMSSAVHNSGSRLIFDQSIADNFFPLVFPQINILTFASAVSLQVGRLWGETLPGGTLLHHRIVAGPVLTSMIVNSARIGQDDIRLDRLSEKVAKRAKEVLAETTNAPLPASLVVPGRWRMMVEFEDGKLWAEACPAEDVAEMRSSFTLPPDVLEVLGVNIPPSLRWTNSAAKSQLSERVIGNDSNISDITEKISLFSSSPDRRKPLFSGLLLGPTGTGKTHLAKTMSQVYGRPLVKIDCSTLQDEGLLQEAIFGFGQDSLASRLAVHRASVILLDEIDKAHPSVWFLLMQALDEGVMKSSSGRSQINLDKSVVFATSNQLAEELAGSTKQFEGRSRQDVDAALRSVLKSCADVNEACVERFDAVYIMAPLEGKNAIILWQRILSEEFGVKASDNVVAKIATQHGDALGAPGARAVRRACAEIVSRSHEWGLKIEDGQLVSDEVLRPMSRRQKLWLAPSQRAACFSGASTHPWAAELLQEAFEVNANKTAPKSPQAIVLLVGPAGSGKTHLPEEMNRLMAKGEPEIVECSSTGSWDEMSTYLFGEPGGRRGALTDALLHQPDKIVIFDGIDKAPKGMLDHLAAIMSMGKASDRSTGSSVDLLQAAFFFTSNALAEEMQELCDLVGSPSSPEDHPKMIPSEACASAAAMMVERGELSQDQASMFDLIIPFGLPNASGILDHSMRVISGILEEYGLPPEDCHLVAKQIPESVLTTLDSIGLKREACKAASTLSKKCRETAECA